MDEQKLRQAWVNEAKHSISLESEVVSSEFSAACEAYVAGQIGADDLVRLTRSRLGLDNRASCIRR